ncbi:hypothetical protein [Candidatus Nitrosocosmicus sp. R]
MEQLSLTAVVELPVLENTNFFQYIEDALFSSLRDDCTSELHMK